MSLLDVDLVGAQTPRVEVTPELEWSEADDAAFLAAGYGLVADAWQSLVLGAWLGRRADGRLAAGRCGLAVPRQNGKNGAVEILELFLLVVLGRKILHTAHEVKTARKAFLRLVGFFEDPKHPELMGLVSGIRRTNGQEAIFLTNGASIEFVARSRGSGRGFTVDLLVLDEAQELTDEQLEALLPTMSAAPSGDPQMILIGTPPPPGSPGEVFARMREDALGGNAKRLAWHEWSVESMPSDLSDRALWAETNPALGGRLLASTIEDELAAMSADGFARERLGLWVTRGKQAVIDSELWASRATSSPPTEGRVAYGLDMTPDRAWVAISAARVGADGTVHGECVEHKSVGHGTLWVIDWLAERWAGGDAVVIDAQSPAMSLVPDLVEAGVKPMVTRASDMAKACGMFFDAVREGTLTHFDQPALNAAVANAGKRGIGQAGGWGWDRRSPDVDISPLVSLTLAVFGVRTSKRRAGRRSKMVVM